MTSGQVRLDHIAALPGRVAAGVVGHSAATPTSKVRGPGRCPVGGRSPEAIRRAIQLVGTIVIPAVNP